MINVLKVVACKNKNDNTRINSTSGGVFPALCEYIKSQNGYVCGVEFDENFMSRHGLTKSPQKVNDYVGSKYSQSSLNDIFFKIQDLLNEGELVLFTGTPCQVAGLKSFLHQDYKNLILVDIICMGVASPRVWNEYLKFEFPESNILSIRLKDKRWGWHRFSVKIDSPNRKIHEPGGSNIFMRAYIEGYIMRKSCMNCRFKGANRFSDLTIADCWGIEDIKKEFDDNMGTSVIFINTEKGLQIYDQISKYMFSFEIPFTAAVKKNIYYNISKEDHGRDKFMKQLINNPQRTLRANKPTKTTYILRNRLKRIIRKLVKNHERNNT